jgi:hypothetical protein
MDQWNIPSQRNESSFAYEEWYRDMFFLLVHELLYFLSVLHRGSFRYSTAIIVSRVAQHYCI